MANLTKLGVRQAAFRALNAAVTGGGDRFGTAWRSKTHQTGKELV